MKKHSPPFRMYLYALAVILVAVILFQPRSHEEQLVAVAREALPKSVMIEVTAAIPDLVIQLGGLDIYRSTHTVVKRYLGSGVFISPHGHILTVAHLFGEGELQSISVTDYNGVVYGATLLLYNTTKDLGLIRISEKTPHYAKLADPRTLQVGQEVIAIGNPFSLEFSVTHGIISYLNRDFKEKYNVTQSDAFINPGNSGGPLFNLKGELIGINSFMVPPVNAPIFTGCGFSVQVGQIIEFLTDFMNLPKVKRV